MMNITWLDEESTYLFKKNEKPPSIVSHRRTKHSDLPEIKKLIRMKTYDMFGNVSCDQVYEEACFSLVQLNEKEEIISHISLCTYPNVPSVPPNDWICWMMRHYGAENVTSGNVMFIHFLVWDTRYTEEFFDKLLNAIFSSNTFCLYVILVHPPCIVPVDVIEEHMTRVVPRWEQDSYKVQALYMSIRHKKNPKLKIRLAVEEDNDDIVRIIDTETKKLKELYGDYYISEMMRYPDGQRQIIVAETDGIITGVMCLTKVIDVELINEVFELGPYNGLIKPHENHTRDQNQFKESLSVFSLLPESANNRTASRPEISANVKTKDKLFVCRCSQQKSPKTEEICTICFPGVTIEKTMKSSEFLEKGSPEETFMEEKVAKTVIEKLEKDKGMEEVAEEKLAKTVIVKLVKDKGMEEVAEEKEKIKKTGIDKEENTEEIIIEKEKVGNEEEIETEKVENKEIIIEEEKEELKEQRETEKTNEEEGTAKKIFENMKVKNLSEAAFDSLLMSNDEEKDSGLTQLLLAQSINLQSKIRISVFADTLSDIPSRKETVSNIEISELMLQEIKAPPRFPSPISKVEPNAFILELFSLHNDLEEQRGQDFLQAAFDCFPDLDYCAILLPSTHHFFPFLENFMRVPLRFNKDFPMALYLTHRAIFLGTFKSRQVVPYDIEGLKKLLCNIPTGDVVLKDCEKAILQTNREKECYVFLCEDILIGVAVMSFEREINFLRRHYHIDDYVSIQNVSIDGHGRLLHFVTMPIFAVCHRFFYREILRLSEMTILYYRLYESDASALTRTHPLVTCLDIMIPVEPRIRPEFSFQQYCEKNLEPPMSCQEKEKFSLFLITPQFSTIPKLVINTKIVVVGASDCGLAFIEFLALGSKSNSANFTDLTLISTNGLPNEKKRSCLEMKLIPFKGRYCHAYRHMKSGRAWFNIVTGTVIGINRKEKYVTVKKLGHLSYDYLILTCGLQFQKPKLSEEIQEQKRDNPKETEAPINCFSINDDTEAAVCVKKLQDWTDNFKTKKFIVFYGSNIECYCALNGFLEMGVKGSWIILIEKSFVGCETHDKIFSNDTEVDYAVMNQIVESGVEILSGWDLIDWELQDDSNGGSVIKNLKIESKFVTKTVPCDILMSFSEKRICFKTFMAFSRSGLVFDGLLVIDPEGRTNDPFIFAGGTVTKYSRKYMADSMKLKYFNSLEVGERLAKHLKKIIESHLKGEERLAKSKSKKYKLLPVFQDPRCIYCILPGGYYYLHVQKPGKKLTRRVAISQNVYGDVCVTGNCTSNIGYFRIHINPYGFIETCTCFSKKSFEILNLIYLYGKHESLLNDLKNRFQNSLIVDFFSYFREPWAIALFSDRFNCFQVENRAILLSRLSGGESLVDEILKALVKSNWNQVSEEDQKILECKFIGSAYQEEIEKSLIDFLQYSEDELPMYCIPRRVKQILRDFQERNVTLNIKQCSRRRGTMVGIVFRFGEFTMGSPSGTGSVQYKVYEIGSLGQVYMAQDSDFIPTAFKATDYKSSHDPLFERDLPSSQGT